VIGSNHLEIKINMRAYLCLCLLIGGFGAAAQHISEEALKPLNFLVGEWKVEVEARLSKSGPWEKSEARSVIKKIIGESVFEDEYTGTKQGRVLTAKSWLANDNRTRLYQKVFADSDHGVLILYEGKLEDKTLTLQTDLQLNDVHLLIRSQYHFISHDLFTIESARSTDEGKTWDKTGMLKYSRVK
jgi:hypothetical protein